MKDGFGPSWGNSLFEDNAEYGLGMHLGVKQLRNRVTEFVSLLNEKDVPGKLKGSHRRLARAQR
jgi:pyruvate-ferredoxin/flavodoxin oxidoreductase